VNPGSPDGPLIRSLRAAVEASPDDVPLRLHLAELLLDAGGTDEAIGHIAAALHRAPGSAKGRALMARAVAAQGDRAEGTLRLRRGVPAAQRRRMGDEPTERHSFNWAAAEGQFIGVQQPFVDSGTAPLGEPLRFDVESGKFTFSDVRGQAEVKRRLLATVINPARNADPRRRAMGQQRGGLLLYGPSGCGKTFVARAVAGELESRFLAVNLADGPELYTGGSPERLLREMFAEVRRAAPCVVFLDEVDAAGRNRNLLNALIAELDSGGGPDAPLVLAATSNPWDLDPLLRRPGRFDRTLLVAPPDPAAREAILHHQLRDRRLGAGVNVRELAARTEEFSVTDLAQLCDNAAERAAAESEGDEGRKRVRGGRLMGVRDFDAALAEVRASTGSWLSVARNATKFANSDGSYDDLHRYLKSRRMAP
jgi:hypothetical protein